MAIGDVIVGIDIGTSKVSTVVGKVNNFKQIEIICNTSCKCNGIKKAQLVDEKSVAIAIEKTIHEAEEIAGFSINSAYFTIPGKYVAIVQNSVEKEIKDRLESISQKDVFDSIKMVREIEMPDEFVLVDIVPDKFVLEDGKIVEDPIGNYGSKFTLVAQLVLANKEYVKKIQGICKELGIETDGFVPITLAERNLVLDTNEFSDNVMILDIGGGNTEFGVFFGNSFIYTNTLPIGGDNITTDIEYVLQISHEEAEKLKRQIRLAMKSFINNDHEIVLNTYSGNEPENKTIKSSDLVDIIEARIEEIYSLVNREITYQGIKSPINTIILTGDGIATIDKADQAGKIIFNTQVKVSTARLMTTVKSEYRTSYALVRYVSQRPFTKRVSSTIDTKTKESIVRVFFGKIRDFFYS